MPAPPKSLLDANQCLQGAYDDQVGAFRVETTPETGGITEVSIDAADDSVRIGDGHGHFVAVNSDGSINVDIGNITLNSAEDSIQIGNGLGDFLSINPDGSINVDVSSGPSTVYTPRNIFNEVVSVASGVTTTIVSYTVPGATKAILQRTPVSGENIAQYDVLVNSSRVDTQRTYFGGELNSRFDFIAGNDQGLMLNTGDTVIVQVTHSRPSVGNFNGRIQVLEY